MRAALLRAYRSTRYQVAGIDVRIGRRCPRMDTLLAAHRVREAVLITAYNPRSRPMAPGWNRHMQARLHQRLRNRTVLPARGDWRRWSEAHVFVFGSRVPLRQLARQFRQNAIVIVKLGQPAYLEVTS